MKKKLAVLLALCLMLGALPLSALAATYKLTTKDGTEVGTLTTDDETGAYEATNLTGDFAAYSIAPGTIKVGDKTATLTAYYDEAPLTITATLNETAEESWTVTFAVGDHGTGTMEPVQVPKSAAADWTVPAPDGITAANGYVFAGWKVGDTETIKQGGEKLALEADVTLTATWAQDEKVVVTEPSVTDNTTTVTNVDVTAKTETVILDLQGEAANATNVTVNIDASVVTKLTSNSVKTVEVQSTVATVTMPVEAFEKQSGDTAVSIEKKPPTSAQTTVATVISVSVGAAGSVTNLDTPISISFSFTTTNTIQNPVVATLKGGKWIRCRGTATTTTATILTRHLSDFAVVDLADVEPDELDATASGNTVTIKTWQGETAMAAFEIPDGDGVRTVVTTGMTGGDSSGALATIKGSVSGNGVTFKGAWSLNGDKEFSDTTGTPAHLEDIMAEKK